MVKAPGIKRLFDEDANWVPAMGRSFTMKRSSKTPEEKTQKAEDTQTTVERDLSFVLKGTAISNAQGFERAYEAPGSTYTYGDTIFIARTERNAFIVFGLDAQLRIPKDALAQRRPGGDLQDRQMQRRRAGTRGDTIRKQNGRA